MAPSALGMAGGRPLLGERSPRPVSHVARPLPALAAPNSLPNTQGNTYDPSHAKENNRLMLIRREQAVVRPTGRYPIGGTKAGL